MKMDSFSKFDPNDTFGNEDYWTIYEILVHYIKFDDIQRMRDTIQNRDVSFESLFQKLLVQDDLLENLEYKDDFIEDLSVRHPMSLAILFLAEECFRELVSHGATVFVVETQGENNLAHLLAYAESISDSDKVLRIYDSVLGVCVTQEDRKRLLWHRNAQGLTPLELSAKLGSVRMFKAILYTEGAHRQVLWQKGKAIQNFFEFSYGSEKLADNSFLWQLTRLEDTPKNAKAIASVIQIPAIKKMIKSKFYSAIPLVVLWIVVRLVYTVFLIYFDWGKTTKYKEFACNADQAVRAVNKKLLFPDWIDQTDKNFYLDFGVASFIYSFVYGLTTILFDLVEVIFIKKKSSQPLRQHWRYFISHTSTNTSFYRITALLFAINNSVFTFMSAVWTFFLPVNVLLSVNYIINLTLLAFNLLYFIQLLPTVGSFAIGFHRMLAALSKFAILQLALQLLFLQFFKNITMTLCRPSDECWVGPTFYGVFEIMLNVRGPVPKGDRCIDAGITLLQIVNAIYIFTVAVLTVNYLVAVFSSIYSDYSDNNDASVLLHRLDMSLIIERRKEMLKCGFCKCSRRNRHEIVRVIEMDKDSEMGLVNLRLVKAQNIENKVCRF